MPTITEAAILHLEQAQRRIENPDCWCRIDPALDAFGGTVNPLHPAAVQYCAFASLHAVIGIDGAILWQALIALDNAALRILETTATIHDYAACAYQAVRRPIVHLNDCHQYGHQYVIQAYELAKANLREQEARKVSPTSDSKQEATMPYRPEKASLTKTRHPKGAGKGRESRRQLPGRPKGSNHVAARHSQWK